jgi:hypothetical protein
MAFTLTTRMLGCFGRSQRASHGNFSKEAPDNRLEPAALAPPRSD